MNKSNENLIFYLTDYVNKPDRINTSTLERSSENQKTRHNEISEHTEVTFTDVKHVRVNT